MQAWRVHGRTVTAHETTWFPPKSPIPPLPESSEKPAKNTRTTLVSVCCLSVYVVVCMKQSLELRKSMHAQMASKFGCKHHCKQAKVGANMGEWRPVSDNKTTWFLRMSTACIVPDTEAHSREIRLHTGGRRCVANVVSFCNSTWREHCIG